MAVQCFAVNAADRQKPRFIRVLRWKNNPSGIHPQRLRRNEIDSVLHPVRGRFAHIKLKLHSRRVDKISFPRSRFSSSRSDAPWAIPLVQNVIAAPSHSARKVLGISLCSAKFNTYLPTPASFPIPVFILEKAEHAHLLQNYIPVPSHMSEGQYTLHFGGKKASP